MAIIASTLLTANVFKAMKEYIGVPVLRAPQAVKVYKDKEELEKDVSLTELIYGDEEVTEGPLPYYDWPSGGTSGGGSEEPS